MNALGRKISKHSTVALVAVLVMVALFALGVRFGMDTVLNAASRLLDFFEEQAVTILFALVAFSVMVWILKLHFSDDGDYKNFKLQRLLTDEKGAPDPKRISLWLAQGAGFYAFFYLLIHDKVAFGTFGIWFLGVIFTYHGANEVFGKTPTVVNELKQKDHGSPPAVTT